MTSKISFQFPGPTCLKPNGCKRKGQKGEVVVECQKGTQGLSSQRRGNREPKHHQFTTRHNIMKPLVGRGWGSILPLEQNKINQLTF